MDSVCTPLQMQDLNIFFLISTMQLCTPKYPNAVGISLFFTFHIRQVLFVLFSNVCFLFPD